MQLFIDQISMFPVSLKQVIEGQMGPNKRMEHFNTTVSSLRRFSTVKTTTKNPTDILYDRILGVRTIYRISIQQKENVHSTQQHGTLS